MTLEAVPLARDPARAVPARLTPSGLLSLLAVTAVLIVVSVPRLRGMALQENEVDARATARQLVLALRALDAEGSPSLAELLELPELAGLRADGELLEHGRLLRRHGYLFELTVLPPALALAAEPRAWLGLWGDWLAERRAVRAWPWHHGATGRATFLATEAGLLLMRDGAPSPGEGRRALGRASLPPDGWQPAD